MTSLSALIPTSDNPPHFTVGCEMRELSGVLRSLEPLVARLLHVRLAKNAVESPIRSTIARGVDAGAKIRTTRRVQLRTPAAERSAVGNAASAADASASGPPRPA